MIPRQPHTRALRQVTPVRSGQVYSYGTAVLAKPTVRRIPGRFKLIAFVLLALFVSGHFAWAQHVSAQTEAAHLKQQQIAAEEAHRAMMFRQTVEAIIADHPELDIQVAVGANSGPISTMGVPTTFDAASTAKLLSAATVLHQIDQGKLSLHTDIDGQSVQQWLAPMIIHSDDTAWAELNAYIGHDALTAYASSVGIEDYDADANSLQAADVTLVLQKLYDHSLLSNASRSLLLSYLSQANYRDFGVAAVPSSDRVYHKIGMDEDNVHDALLIVHGSRSLALTIYTNGHGIYNWDARKAVMQDITRAAVDAYL